MNCCKTKNSDECRRNLNKLKMENKKLNRNKIWILAFGLIAVFALIIFFTKDSSATSFENINKAEKIEIYKSLTCGCCSVYSSYVDGKVTSKVDAFDVQNPDEIKRQYGIPQELESCHTTVIGNYFVEGHVPLEAVEKLLREQPDIKGIAMPGMPSGSPGMPGQKYGDFVIYAVNYDGTYDEFTRI